jgi:beta-glucosidase
MLDLCRVLHRRRTCPVMAAISIGIAGLWPWTNAAADDAGTRARRLASAMTLEEKLDYLGGINGMSIRPVPRLGIPEIRTSDGPLGVRQVRPSTRYPAGVALAATWEPELARAEGVAMGRDCRARGIHILLAPAVNIHRVPVNGRNFEYMSGEDPYLASQMVAPFVEGVQSQGVVATVKHFAANNQEYQRRSIDARVDERTLREIYLPAFAAAVVEGRAGAVMDAYNRLNGEFCTENAWLNEQVLRKEWGFQGLLMSDWEATHSTVEAFRGGLDLEMPSGQHFNAGRLSEALAAHQISAEQVDEKVVHILTLLIRMGFLDRPQQDASIPERDPASEQAALAVACAGIVLLKNQEKLLPLDRTRIRSLAVLGPRAYPGVATGGGSSYVNPTHTVSVLEGLRQALAPDVRIDLVSAFVPSYLLANFYHVNQAGELVPGLHGEYFDSDGFAGPPKMLRDDEHIDFVWHETGPFFEPLDAGQFSIRWTGYLIPEASGPHFLRAQADGAIRVYLDGNLVIDAWRENAPRVTDAAKYLKAGRPYALRIEYRNRAGGAVARFAFAPLQVPETLRNYDAAVVCVGFDQTTEGEGSDRLFQLPAGQDDLVEQVEALNPKTVVVLFGGGGADVTRWIDHTPAFLHAWYPGQEGGTAIAELLTGAISPSGKLPVTFDRQLEDNPVMANYPSQDGGRTVHYDEGVFVGYRAANRRAQTPLFPFGYGLTYTHFDFRNLTITRDQPGHRWQISFELSNDGDRPGSEVAQLYVAFPKSPVPRPEQELKRFTKVFLQPGQTRAVTLSLPEQALGYFDVTNHRWSVVPGEYEFRVGASSQDLPLRGKATLPDNQNEHGPAANGT